mmetsp:Transcript_18367/g.39684  ORF Transcript_18367/g.39684 Transcript_18367/m.39684 type:complete len:212 (+) Transcript_18367:72-707(+)
MRPSDSLRLLESQSEHDRNPALFSRSDHKRRLPRSKSDHRPRQRPEGDGRPGLTRSTSVRFNSSQKVHIFHEKPHPDLWYNGDDFNAFRDDHMEEAKHLARSTKWTNDAVLKTLKQCYGNEEKPDDKTLKGLQHFLEKHQCAGLERFTSRELFRDKRDRRKKLAEILNEIQEHHFEDDELRDRVLRVACEKISRPSVLFAQSLAKAQSCRF